MPPGNLIGGGYYQCSEANLGGRWVKYAQVEASGTIEGILMCWNNRACEGEILEI